ncbi:unnamed protein product [Medioppia subpectinata]|uniref:Uncharacterized protein n=1 Tax=Medioppia subpectinata TaxID=1979941 RepID=A0A7R9KUN5_9ACAR|nr:unnamed protein product [Medioppia subpectinata]CAG2109780.1 unnamed protein product [Medioppia subpectinata]
MMSEDKAMANTSATTTAATESLDSKSVDKQLMMEMSEYRNDFIDFFLSVYGKQFDKRFREVTDALAAETEAPEKADRFRAIRDQHMRQCEASLEKRLDAEFERLFGDQSVIDKLLTDVTDKPADDELPAIQEALRPVKRQFVDQLQNLERLMTERLDSKTNELSELTESVAQAFTEYEAKRKSLQKSVLKMVNKLETIESPELD